MTMNVADGIEAAPLRSAHDRPRSLSKSGKQSFEHQQMLYLDGF